MSYFQVRLTLAGRKGNGAVLVVEDLDRSTLDERILGPRALGAPLTVRGRTLQWSEIEAIRIAETEQDAKTIAEHLRAAHREANQTSSVVVMRGTPFSHEVADQGRDVTDELITTAPGEGTLSPVQTAGAAAPSDPDRARRVMVVLGRDTSVNKALFAWLRSVGLEPMEWERLKRATGSGTPYIGEVLDRGFAIAQAVVVLFTPDDLVQIREDLTGAEDVELAPAGQARPNVLLEAGMALGRDPDRTILVEHGPLRGLSDLHGRHTIRLANGVRALNDLAGALQQAGCAVSRDGSDWLDAEAFAAADPSQALAASLLAKSQPATAPRSQSVYAVRSSDPRSELLTAPEVNPLAKLTGQPAADGLKRFIGESLAAATGGTVWPNDVVEAITERVRGAGPEYDLLEAMEGLPGRRPDPGALKRVLYELVDQNWLQRAPNGIELGPRLQSPGT